MTHILTMGDELHQLAELVRIYNALGPRARRVLDKVAERLELGQQRYNDDLNDGRYWLTEAGEEALDLIVYSMRALQDVQASKSDVPAGPCDKNGLAADGTAWLPPEGTKVRVVALSPAEIDYRKDYSCGVDVDDTVIVISSDYADIDDSWAFIESSDGCLWCRVVPA